MTGPADFAAASEALANAFSDGRVDLARLRATVDSMVPFSNLVGVRLIELTAESAVAEIPDDPRYLNHLGTVHAAALFLAAEVACAAAFAGGAASRLADLRFFVLRQSTVWFLNAGRGAIRATGTVDQSVVDEIIAYEHLAQPGYPQFELTGTAMVRDSNNLLLAKISFDYLCVLATPA